MVAFAQAVTLLATSREDLGASTITTNWFEILEAQSPDDLRDDFEGTLERVAETMDPNYSRNSGTEYTVHGYNVTAQIDNTTNDGFFVVSITVRAPGDSKMVPVRLDKDLNRFSSETVTNIFANPEGGGE